MIPNIHLLMPGTKVISDGTLTNGIVQENKKIHTMSGIKQVVHIRWNHGQHSFLDNDQLNNISLTHEI
jgi:hypothetical protein